MLERVDELLDPDRFLGRKHTPIQIGPGEGVRCVVHVHGKGRESVVLGVHEGIHPVVLEEHVVKDLAVDGMGSAHGGGRTGRGG